jgi:hypothetical protein
MSITARQLALAGAIALAVVVAFFAGRYAPRRPTSILLDVMTETRPPFNPLTGRPNVNEVWPEDLREPEPRAVEARKAVIARDAASIEEECRKAAGGDWKKWQRQTEPYRDDLQSRVDGLTNVPPSVFGPEYVPLAGQDGFPLFEIDSRLTLKYLYEPSCLDAVRRDHVIAAASRWLSKQGIDLIVLSIPKMTEVHARDMLPACPSDGIIAPHARQTLLELLRDNVEVVDGFRLFSDARDLSSEYLFNTADTHWAPRGQRVMAKEVADRIGRYRFGARARCGPAITRTQLGQFLFEFPCFGPREEYGWHQLTDVQRSLAEKAQTTVENRVTTWAGMGLPIDRKSPVMIIGNSYVPQFKDQLARELNLLVHSRSRNLETTESFADFLREPELLNHVRVVVWVLSEHHFAIMHPMPEAILNSLH